MLCVSGAVDVVCDDGSDRKTFSLDHPQLALFVPPGLWLEIDARRNDSVLIAGIPLLIVISPYEYQLRGQDQNVSALQPVADVMIPQKKIEAFLSSHDINALDPVSFFRAQVGSRTASLFLPYDPMHFSETGHSLMFKFLERQGVLITSAFMTLVRIRAHNLPRFLVVLKLKREHSRSLTDNIAWPENQKLSRPKVGSSGHSSIRRRRLLS
jgi:hypothetical protein